MSARLFEEFPGVSTDRWMEVVAKDLKGQDFEKRLVSTTEDGIRVKPFYRKEDLPSEMPAARGSHGDGLVWRMREEVREADISAANAHALRCLNSGAEELAWHTYPIGSFIDSPADLEALLKGVYIEMAPVHWMSGPFSPAIAAMFADLVESRGLDVKEIRGSVDLDPILDRAAGWVTGGFEGWKAPFTATLELIRDRLPAYTTFVVRGALIEKAGASLAQEIAFSAALLAEYLEEAEALDWPGGLDALVARAEIRLGVGSQYLLEIAKLRAARVVIANVLKAFGVLGVQPRIHAVTTSSTKTLYDSHNNLLRATIESMAAVIGGCDSLSVTAFDQGYHAPDEFSEHLARNTELLIKEEAHLEKVSDPLGGSYAIEALTASIAEAAWALFKEVQSRGGFIAAWESGWIPAELDRVRAQKIKASQTRRTPLVGTSIFPNLKEKKASEIQPRPAPAVVESCMPGDSNLKAKVSSAGGASNALSALRLAEPFEKVRLKVESLSKAPVIQLLLSGDPVMRKARAAFCQGFFGCGGFDVKETVLAGELPPADLYVLCSSDAEYVALAEQVMALSPSAPVWVAGLPADSVDALKGAGVADFVHLRLNPVETLSKLLESLAGAGVN